MRDNFIAALSSTLLRVLELDPDILLEDAIARVTQVSVATDLAFFDKDRVQTELNELSRSYKRQGVINPKWLAERNLKPHFFLINAEPGRLDALMEQKETVNHTGTSQYIVYGDWDSLLILYGTEEEAKKQLEILSSSIPDQPSHFSASHVPYLYRHRSSSYKDMDVSRDCLNKVVLDFDSPTYAKDRNSLLKANILLGSVWMPKVLPRERVIGFTGINVLGSASAVLSGEEILDALLHIDILQQTLVHLFQIDQGRPYHFYAKLVCDSMTELDAATTAIGLARIGPVRLEGSTVVVANGTDYLPTYREPKLRSVGTRLIVDDIQYLAKDLVEDLNDNAVSDFNSLSSERKLTVLVALGRIRGEFTQGGWDERWQASLDKAVRSFQESVLESELPGRLTGPVMEAATVVEEVMKHTIHALAEDIFAGDFVKAQNEMRLPTKNLRRLSLGKSAAALRHVASDERFKEYAQALSEDRLDALDKFVVYRNLWAHGAPPWNSKLELIDHASSAVSGALRIIRWVTEELVGPSSKTSSLNPKKEKHSHSIVIAETPQGRRSGAFLSYSSRDREMAIDIATALRAVGNNVWYDDWEIDHGESIMERIEEGLARNDTLLILLSPASVKSKWVQLELNTVLMRQLSGQLVRIIPLLIEDCEVPDFLLALRYIDFRENFQEGIMKLMRALSKDS